MMSAKTALVIAIFALAGCSNQGVPAATPTISTVQLTLYATNTTSLLLADLTREYARLNPNFVFEVGIGNNFQSLAEQTMRGEIILFLSTHLPSDSSLWAAPIGMDGLAIVGHGGTLPEQLSIDQIREIYRGRVSNWQEVGGNDTMIQVISREDGAGTRAEFDKLVMGGAQTTPSALVASSSTAMTDNIRAIPGSIGYLSLAQVNENVGLVAVNGVLPSKETLADNTYPLRSTLFVVSGAEPEDDIYRAFIVWLQSPDGQAIVARHYTPLLAP